MSKRSDVMRPKVYFHFKYMVRTVLQARLDIVTLWIADALLREFL